MSGQPYRYFTDPTKFRTEYMDALGLQADINALNLDANKTYKATGQLPAVSQMSDTRTTTEILADTEKLKIDLIQTIAKVSSVPFGQLVVKSIINSPLNSDNKLLVFTAQRIDDIVANLKKIYKYGIKGDSNDAEQFVSFVSTMFNDKNALTAQTKSYMNRMGMKSINSTTPYSQIFEILNKYGASVINWRNAYLNNKFPDKLENSQIDKTETKAHSNAGSIADLVSVLIKLIPTNPAIMTVLENKVLNDEEDLYGLREEGTSYSTDSTGYTNTLNSVDILNPKPISVNGSQSGSQSSSSESSEFKSNATRPSKKGKKLTVEEERKVIFAYLNFLNYALPNPSALVSAYTPLEKAILSYDSSRKKLYQQYSSEIGTIRSKGTPAQVQDAYNSFDPTNLPLYGSVLTNISKVNEILINLLSLLRPNVEWQYKELIQLKDDVEDLISNYRMQFSRVPEQMEPTVKISNPPTITNYDEDEEDEGNEGEYTIVIGKNEQEDKQIITTLFNEVKDARKAIPRDKNDPNYQARIEEYEIANQKAQDAKAEYEQKYSKVWGTGLMKRRGRPKGCGISKPKTYKESVKAHSVLDKGIMETPRFIKFGKYLLNNHKLNNEDIFALKRPSGGNIVEIPSIKISKNLSSVIKKMVGGSMPTYSDISKLSEPEKAYLHKVSQKSNILDKFDIPAPSKDQTEKDIHQFEVMRGEIMAGNDSKELIKKFKLHLMKLSKSGTLPKREVQEILEELIELGF